MVGALERLLADYESLNPSDKFFSGAYSGTYDDKGRIVVPAEYRITLELVQPQSAVLALTLWKEEDITGIEVIPEIFYNKEAKLLDMSDPKRRHEFGAKYFLVSFDTQGRIVVPVYLAKMANLTKRCKVTVDGNTQTFVFYRTPE